MRSAILFGLIACLALSLVLAFEESSPVQSNDLSAVEKGIGQAVESEVRAKRQFYGGYGRPRFGYGGYGGYGRYGYGGYPFYGGYGGFGGLGGYGRPPFFGGGYGPGFGYYG
ncbi:glycine-rich cell wall structural protein [Drosophila serrata]|uniref:glycine-rich cell wall structural protein n=1 Tax=Drosophila serrata TaxID=7274 RepID=UPI000A1D01B8|nr:glycine-rich cell wall structural protein [Drosophila serrata]